MQRGRKSAASLAVVAMTPQGARPEPPEHLNEAEAAEWRAIVARMPPDYFLRESWGMLAELCRFTVRSRLVGNALAADGPGWLEGDPDRFNKMSQIHERDVRTMNALARSLRLTHQSRYGNQKANTAAQAVASRKPWETDFAKVAS